jgi:Holliday junction resolvase RusA-like endonuclease
MRTWTTADGVRHWADEGYQAALIPMAAHGKARPRVTVKGTYMPQSYTEARESLMQFFGSVTLRLPVSVKVTVARRTPSSWPKARRAAAVWTPCPVKPDADNIAGWVLDSLFAEDSAVVWVECLKVWGPRDLLKVEVWEVCADEAAVGPHEMAFE